MGDSNNKKEASKESKAPTQQHYVGGDLMHPQGAVRPSKFIVAGITGCKDLQAAYYSVPQGTTALGYTGFGGATQTEVPPSYDVKESTVNCKGVHPWTPLAAVVLNRSGHMCLGTMLVVSERHEQHGTSVPTACGASHVQRLHCHLIEDPTKLPPQSVSIGNIDEGASMVRTLGAPQIASLNYPKWNDSINAGILSVIQIANEWISHWYGKNLTIHPIHFMEWASGYRTSMVPLSQWGRDAVPLSYHFLKCSGLAGTIDLAALMDRDAMRLKVINGNTETSDVAPQEVQLLIQEELSQATVTHAVAQKYGVDRWYSDKLAAFAYMTLEKTYAVPKTEGGQTLTQHVQGLRLDPARSPEETKYLTQQALADFIQVAPDPAEALKAVRIYIPPTVQPSDTAQNLKNWKPVPSRIGQGLKRQYETAEGTSVLVHPQYQCYQLALRAAYTSSGYEGFLSNSCEEWWVANWALARVPTMDILTDQLRPITDLGVPKLNNASRKDLAFTMHRIVEYSEAQQHALGIVVDHLIKNANTREEAAKIALAIAVKTSVQHLKTLQEQTQQALIDYSSPELEQQAKTLHDLIGEEPQDKVLGEDYLALTKISNRDPHFNTHKSQLTAARLITIINGHLQEQGIDAFPQLKDILKDSKEQTFTEPSATATGTKTPQGETVPRPSSAPEIAAETATSTSSAPPGASGVANLIDIKNSSTQKK